MNSMLNSRGFITTRILPILGLIGSALFITYYIYLIHTRQIQPLLEHIRHLGFTGVILGIFLKTIVNIFPVPGEFMSVFLMEVYGAAWGGFYSWLGGIFGAIFAMYFTRWMARPLLEHFALPFLQKVESFIQNRETFGLLVMRFVPIVPYHLVNYAAGLFRVRLWGFAWTTAVGILPFTVAMSGMYAGVRHGSITWGIIGGVIFILLVAIGWFFRKRSFKRDID
jgi:uncharacterized membrane protein YdjX (TVP38/TMEM64 family)